ncbi:MAG: hypothetical protein IAF08_01290 [Rhizobacter sp.]|nr:hypothetical protein [Chlorobiales bacterium]
MKQMRDIQASIGSVLLVLCTLFLLPCTAACSESDEHVLTQTNLSFQDAPLPHSDACGGAENLCQCICHVPTVVASLSAFAAFAISFPYYLPVTTAAQPTFQAPLHRPPLV